MVATGSTSSCPNPPFPMSPLTRFHRWHKFCIRWLAEHGSPPATITDVQQPPSGRDLLGLVQQHYKRLELGHPTVNQQCNPQHIYSEVCPVVFSETLSQESVDCSLRHIIPWLQGKGNTVIPYRVIRSYRCDIYIIILKNIWESWYICISLHIWKALELCVCDLTWEIYQSTAEISNTENWHEIAFDSPNRRSSWVNVWWKNTKKKKTRKGDENLQWTVKIRFYQVVFLKIVLKCAQKLEQRRKLLNSMNHNEENFPGTGAVHAWNP